MHPILRMLETLGAGVDRSAEIDAVLATQPAEIRGAWAQRDLATLARLLGGRSAMACSVFAPEEDQPAEEPVRPDERPDEDEIRAA